MSLIRITDTLARTPARRDAIEIIEAGLEAIDTDRIVRKSVVLNGSLLVIGRHQWDLEKFRHLHVLGFGKASRTAAQTLWKILGNRIYAGTVLDTVADTQGAIEVCETAHPIPSERNVACTAKIIAECERIGSDDLIFVLVSGGGSSMLCWPASECEQQRKLYIAAETAALTIQELNTVRKHLSALKGGGLIQYLSRATVIGLVFCDIPGNHPEFVASGPTYPDTSTIADAQTIIDHYNLGSFTLNETPKDQNLFRTVTNIVLASSSTALEAMEHRATSLGYRASIISAETIATPEEIVAQLQRASKPKSVILIGGESRISLPANHGTGGRNTHSALVATKLLAEHQTFAAIASDGHDNTDAAGAITDGSTAILAKEQKINISDRITNCDSFPVLQSTGDLVVTGPTRANVADLMFLLSE